MTIRMFDCPKYLSVAKMNNCCLEKVHSHTHVLTKSQKYDHPFFSCIWKPKKTCFLFTFFIFVGSLHTANPRYLKTFLLDHSSVEVIDKKSLSWFNFFPNIFWNIVKHFESNYERKLYLSYSIYKNIFTNKILLLMYPSCV